MISVPQEQVFICPFDTRTPPVPTIPLQVRREDAVTWFECDECQHYWEGQRMREWHPVYDEATRAILKRVYDGTYSATRRILRPVAVDVDAIMTRKLREKMEALV